MGAVPVQDAKWLRSGNRATSPTSARIRAAPAGPMPRKSIRCEPRARTAPASSLVRAFSLASVATRSATSSTAIRRVVLPTTNLGLTVASSRLALVEVRSFPAPPGMSSVSSRCNRFTVCTRAAPRRELITPIHQQSQRHQILIKGEHPKVRSTQCRRSDRVGIGSVGLAGVAGIEHPHPCRELGRDVDHPLTVGEQPLRQRPTHPVGTLNGPPMVRPLPAHVAEHCLVVPAAGTEAAGRQLLLLVVDDLDRHRLLVRIHTHRHTIHGCCLLRLERHLSARAGRATLSRAIPSWATTSPSAPDRSAVRKRATTKRLGSRDRERPVEHLDNSLARPQP